MKGKSGTLCQPDRSALLFDTDTRMLPLKKALEFWEESAGSLYDFYIATPESFYTHGRTLCCGKILLNYCVSVEQKLSRSSYRIGMDGFDHYEVQFFLDGMWRRGDGKLEAQAGSGDLIVHDTAQAHAGSASDFTNVTLFVPRFLLAPLLDRPDEQNMRVIGSDNPLVGLLRSHVIGLFRTLPSLDAAQAALMVSPTVELIAATLNGTERQDNSRGVAAAQFNSIRGYIDEHVLDQGLSVEQLAVKFGISLRKLTYLFSREGGVASYIQKRRLHLARQCLRDQRHAHKSIADIGLGHGFLYAPNFTRAFQQTYGMTPRETRAMARRTWLAGERESPSWFYRASRWGL
ncbi:helix-turn-helix domain-containing protein [Sinorhizobium meliloti]|uniref:helix-turn-helix domain-containing protein n=1 Tax=Rhizobium meliloti TaxID=382 RepID=UPI000B4A0133|nr:helix-turn-helix domain-containing protein [Sinorhizobium meliloti]ASP66596.1 AraC family transcriptional regulator [Sinorhizobium meliloti]MQX03610.1 helix-turn-helix domain-containing protein [Sinorhizobium meliloti]RVK40219.1 helix-turn-helix domain-containing protein [Sinorhizobium meliloti]